MSTRALLRHAAAAGAFVAVGALAFFVGRTTVPVEYAPRPPRAARDVAPSAEKSTESTASPPPVADDRSERHGTDLPPAQVPYEQRTAARILVELVPDASVERRAEATTGADAIRSRAIATAQNAHRTAARAVAADIRRERAFLVDKARGGTMAMLRALRSSRTHPFKLVEDATEFEKHFARTITGPEITAFEFDGRTQPRPGTVLRFPEGTHMIHGSKWGEKGDFPADLLIVGAGRDNTLVRIDQFNARGEVRSLTFRDVTVHVIGSNLTDHRGEAPTTIRMERCRVIGFDSAVMLAANTAAFYATDTRFESGYDGPTSGGHLFRVNDGFLARLERCVFAGPFRSVHGSDSESTYVFDSCRFENVYVPLDKPPVGVRFVNCEVVDLDAGVAAAIRTEWQIDAVIPAESTAHVVDGAKHTVPEGLTVPASLVFPAGQYVIEAAEGFGGHRGVLFVNGKGWDKTLLRIKGEPSCRVLVIRDATLDVSRPGMFGRRVEFALLERVRLVRWGKNPPAVRTRRRGIIVVRDCEILDGFGRSPGRGTVADLHDGTTLRIENSRIDLVGSAFLGGDGLVVLSDSVVNGLPEGRDAKGSWSRNVIVERSTITYRAMDASRPRKPRSLTELNPAWSDRR